MSRYKPSAAAARAALVAALPRDMGSDRIARVAARVLDLEDAARREVLVEAAARLRAIDSPGARDAADYIEGPTDRDLPLSRIWIVRDPVPGLQTLADVFWETTVEDLGDYVIGRGPGQWRRERHAVHLTREAALDDARRRLEVRAATRGIR